MDVIARHDWLPTPSMDLAVSRLRLMIKSMALEGEPRTPAGYSHGFRTWVLHTHGLHPWMWKLA